MDKSTDDTAPSRPSPQEEKDAIAKRSATITKATTRTDEIAGYLGRIDAAVASTLPEFISLHPMGQAVDDFTTLEDAVTKLDKAVSSIKARISYAREVSFPARMDAEESKTFTSADSGNRITRTARIFASIIPEQIDAAYQWLRDNELASLIKETVNSSSLSGAAKEALENGKELPDDYFRVHTKDSVSITRGKKK